MANKKISDFTEITSVGDNDWLEVEISSGNSRKVKKSNLGGGALVLLEQHSASSSASLNITSAITSTYDEYLIEILNLVPATNAVNLLMRMSTNGGSTYDASGIYGYANFASNAGGSGGNGNSGTATAIQANVSGLSNAATGGVSATFKLFNPSSTTVHKRVRGELSLLNSASNDEVSMSSGTYKSTTAVNAFQFLFSSGNISSGTIRVYGVTK